MIEISKKITIISITLMLFVSLVPSISAVDIDSSKIGVQKEVNTERIIDSVQKTESIEKTTEKSIKKQIKKRMRRNRFKDRRFERPERIERDFRMREQIQERKLRNRVKSYRKRTGHFKAKSRKRLNRRLRHYHQSNK